MGKYVFARLAAMSLAVTGVTNASELTPEKVKQYAAASAAVLSAQKVMQEVARLCGPSRWDERNAEAVSGALELRALVLREVAKTNGAKAAEDLARKQDEYLAKKVHDYVGAISALSDQKKQQACRRFQETIERGKWDVALPGPTELVQLPNIVFEEAGAIVIRCSEPHPRSDKDLMKLNVVERDVFEAWVRSKR